jgi:hypothetical protein
MPVREEEPRSAGSQPARPLSRPPCPRRPPRRLGALCLQPWNSLQRPTPAGGRWIRTLGPPCDGRRFRTAGTSADRVFRASSIPRAAVRVGAGHIAAVAAGPESVWAVQTPRLPIEATGCGDAVAALFLGWLLQGQIGARSARRDDRRDLQRHRGDDALRQWRIGARHRPGRAGITKPADSAAAVVRTEVSPNWLSGRGALSVFHETRATHEIHSQPCRPSRRMDRKPASYRRRFPTGSCRPRSV